MSRPSSASVSALSFRGSPLCDLTLTRKVALPFSILSRSLSMISARMSALGAFASVALLPSPTHLLTSVSTDSLSPRYSRSSSARVALSASSSAPPSGLPELHPSTALPTLAHRSTTLRVPLPYQCSPCSSFCAAVARGVLHPHAGPRRRDAALARPGACAQLSLALAHSSSL